MSNVHPFQPYDEPLALPCDLHLEQYLIGCTIREGKGVVYDMVSPFVEADDFFEPLHRQLWADIGELVKQGRPLTPTILKGGFDPLTKVGKSSVAEYLVSLVVNSGPPDNATEFANGIRSMAVRRRIIAASEEMQSIAFTASPIAKIDDVIVACETMLTQATATHRSSGETNPFDEMIAGISDAYQRQTSDGVPWVLPEVRQVAGDDIEYGWLCGLIADSGGGKTSLALQQAAHAVSQGVPTLFLSGDQQASDIATQMACQHLGIDSRDARKGRITEQEFAAIVDYSQRMRALPFKVQKISAPTVDEIGLKVKAFAREFGKAFYIFDHAGKITPNNIRDHDGNRYNQIFNDVHDLMAKVHGAGLMLMQRNAMAAKREVRRPIDSDLSGGASVRQAFDLILGLYVPAIWVEQDLRVAPSGTSKRSDLEIELERVRGKAEIIGMKSRFGDNGIIAHLRWVGRFTRFASLVDDWHGGQQGLEL